MARPYSDALREKFASAYEAGNIGLEKLAATFQVSRGWAERIWKAPDLNPIESCWSVVKARIRQPKARSLKALDVALPLALALISPEKARSCFKHCGYALG